MRKFKLSWKKNLATSSIGAIILLVLQMHFFWIPGFRLSNKLINDKPIATNYVKHYSILFSNDSSFWNRISETNKNIQIIKLEPGTIETRENGIQIERQSILLEGDFFDLLEFQYSVDTNSNSLRIGSIELSKSENEKIQYLMELLNIGNEVL